MRTASSIAHIITTLLVLLPCFSQCIAAGEVEHLLQLDTNNEDEKLLRNDDYLNQYKDSASRRYLFSTENLFDRLFPNLSCRRKLKSCRSVIRKVPSMDNLEGILTKVGQNSEFLADILPKIAEAKKVDIPLMVAQYDIAIAQAETEGKDVASIKAHVVELLNEADSSWRTFAGYIFDPEVRISFLDSRSHDAATNMMNSLNTFQERLITAQQTIDDIANTILNGIFLLLIFPFWLPIYAFCCSRNDNTLCMNCLGGVAYVVGALLWVVLAPVLFLVLPISLIVWGILQLFNQVSSRNRSKCAMELLSCQYDKILRSSTIMMIAAALGMAETTKAGDASLVTTEMADANLVDVSMVVP